MAAIENEKIYALKIRESTNDGSDFGSPDADYRYLFVGEDGSIHLKDAATAVTDFAPSAVTPWAIVPYYGNVGVDVATVGAANRAIYIPCIIAAAVTVTGIRMTVSVQSGNISVGLYDAAGNRVATSGAVACPANGFQDVNFTASYAAAAGRYYLAISADNNTASFVAGAAAAGGAASNRFQDTAHPLPATMTPSATSTGRQLAILGRVSGGHP